MVLSAILQRLQQSHNIPQSIKVFKGIPLVVLPPAKPKYNGGVERSNRIFKEEFYSRTDLLANTVTE
ncbi:MAG: hypothetical protein LBD36_02755, partial [Holosporales bacterium]|nr:hypothetical protein [Holosporales bacterium]